VHGEVEGGRGERTAKENAPATVWSDEKLTAVSTGLKLICEYAAAGAS
jgi:hypothetical protein